MIIIFDASIFDRKIQTELFLHVFLNNSILSKLNLRKKATKQYYIKKNFIRHVCKVKQQTKLSNSRIELFIYFGVVTLMPY